MGHLKKFSFLLSIIAVAVYASQFLIERARQGNSELAEVTRALNVVHKLETTRSKSVDALDKLDAVDRNGSAGPAESALPSAEPAKIVYDPANDVFVSVANNREAMLQAQLATENGKSFHEIKGAVRENDLNGRRLKVSNTHDGREVYAVVRRTGTEDLNALDRINALNIPDHMKAKILKNYQTTGTLPEIIVHERRKPASADTPAAPLEK